MSDDKQQPIVPRPKLPHAKVPFPMTTHLGVFGATGKGKTYWMTRYVKDLVAMGWEGFIIDWKYDRENFSGLNICEYSTDGASGVKILKDKAQLWVMRFDGHGPYVHQFTNIVHRKRVEFFNSGGKSGLPRPVVIAFDEVDTYQDDGDEVKRVFRQGRGNEVHGIAVTPRPQDVAKEIFDNCVDGCVYFGFKDDIRPRLKQRYWIEFPPEYWSHVQKRYHYAFYDSEGKWSAGYPADSKEEDDAAQS